MEKPQIIYSVSRLLYLVIRKFQKTVTEINGKEISPEIDDEGLKKLIKTMYDKLKKKKSDFLQDNEKGIKVEVIDKIKSHV